MIFLNITDFGIKKQNQIIVDKFTQFFNSKNLVEEKEVKITSRVDNSVFFVGSTISVLKPYIINECIPEKGVFMVQRSIRTQLLRKLFNVDNMSEWSSYFRAMGVLMNYSNLSSLIEYVTEYFLTVLNISPDALLFRASSQDADLLAAIQSSSRNIRVEEDTMPITYYRHKYGLTHLGIYGRNFNIAILCKGCNKYKDIANIIVIENSEKKFGIEFAVGASAVLARLNGHNHTIKSSLIADTLKIRDEYDCKLADCISVAANLVFEGIRPNSSNIHNRILKKYLIGLFYYADFLNYSLKDIVNIVDHYILDEYGIHRNIGIQIASYYEKLKVKNKMEGFYE